ncbi:NADH-quinone oxidoreductase subunit H [Opitutaceae bacterium EW11]|nr:NADH-quinone oxidoreductase subunit H [Opitutaceae bacterium EW11]
MTPGLLLFVAACALAVSIVAGPKFPRVWLALVLVGTVSLLGSAVFVLSGAAPAAEWRFAWAPGGDPIHLRLDGLSAIFVALVSVLGGAGAAYSLTYWSDHHYPRSAPRGRAWWSALVLSLVSVLVASNGLHFLIGWEVFTVSAYFLITLDRGWRQVRAAGWLYLAASHVGTVCLFAFFSTLSAKTGSWDLGPLRDRADLAPLLWVALFGFGVKAGLFPLHIWLPSAHANAPSHVSAIMSGAAIKMGVYGLMRFTGWLPQPSGFGTAIISIGAISALLGIAFALAQNDLKRLLAYCSVENVGVITIGLGLALLGASHGHAAWGQLALAGALLHVWNHALFKALLFYGAGAVLHSTGTREMSRLGGLWKTMPWTAALFGLGAAAISGLPPLNGFVSEWLIYLGLFDSVTGRGPTAWAALTATLFLAITGALALATFVKATSIVFLGAPRTKAARHAHDCTPGMRRPMLVLALLCVAIGLAPLFFLPAISRAIGTWNPAWANIAPAAPLATLTPVQVAIALLAVVAAIGLSWYSSRRGVPRTGTWDCGYALPTARMQYTSGSLAGIASGWFFWILQPEKRLRRPRGFFPLESIRLERTPETMLERVIAPFGGGVLRVSTAVRRLQHGHLQSYILYLLAGLATMAGLVLVLEVFQ